MERFIRNANVAKLTKQLEGLPAGAEREMLLKLLAEEKAKGSKPVKPIGCWLSGFASRDIDAELHQLGARSCVVFSASADPVPRRLLAPSLSRKTASS